MADFKLYIEDPYLKEQLSGTDVVTEHTEEYYSQTVILPIEKLEHEIPNSYVQPLKDILTTLTSNKLISSGTGEMIVEAITDLVVGGNLNIHNIGDPKKQKLLATTVDKAVRSAELFGNSIVIKDTDGNLEVYDATQYYKYGNTIEVVRPTIINHKDEWQILTLKEDKDRTYKVTRTQTVGADTYQNRRGKTVEVFEFTNNNINHDVVGQSTLLPILRDIQSIDMTVHLFEKNMYYTKPRIHISNELSELDENGEPTLNLKDDVYVQVDAIGLSENAKPYEVTQFNFEQKAYDEKIKNSLSRCLSKVGLDNRILAWGNGNIERTATEIRSSDDRMINVVERKRTQYYNEIHDLMISYDENAVINFTPATYTSFDQMVTSVVALTGSNMISQEQSLKLLYPNWSQSEINQELKNLKELKNEENNEGSRTERNTEGNVE